MMHRCAVISHDDMTMYVRWFQLGLVILRACAVVLMRQIEHASDKH